MKRLKKHKKWWVAGVLVGILVVANIPNPFISAENQQEIEESQDMEEDSNEIILNEVDTDLELEKDTEIEEEINETDIEENENDETEDIEALEDSDEEDMSEKKDIKETQEEIEPLLLENNSSDVEILDVTIQSETDLQYALSEMIEDEHTKLILNIDTDINLHDSYEISGTNLKTVDINGIGSEISITQTKEKERAFILLDGINEATIQNIIFNQGGIKAADVFLKVKDSSFNNCQSTEDGGAIYTEFSTDIENSIFTGCESQGKGGAVASVEDVEATNSEFISCQADDNGGAIFTKNTTSTKILALQNVLLNKMVVLFIVKSVHI